jgi:hypothetical protein
MAPWAQKLLFNQGGINAIVAVYSYFNISDYEEYYLKYSETKPKFSLFVLPNGTGWP